MSVRRPNQLSDELDAVLDGRPVEINDDLAPLIEAAAELRAALEAVELDPDVAERHLGRVLDGQATVLPLPVRPQPQPQASPWRRRVAAVALAAALTVVPAAMASASTLPGDTLYPMKLAVEQLRVAAAFWSDTAEASERMRIAQTRVEELEGLRGRGATDRIPPAILAVAEAYKAAEDAVSEAVADGGAEALALQRELAEAKEIDGDRVQRVVDAYIGQGVPDPSDMAALTEAVKEVDDAIPVTTTPPTTGTPPPTDPTSTSILTSSTTPAGGSQASTSTSTTVPTTTTTVPTTTTTTPTTTEAPATTEAPQITAAAPEEGSTEASGAGDQADATGTTAP